MKDSAVKCKPPVQAAGKDFELSRPLVNWLYKSADTTNARSHTILYKSDQFKKKNHINAHDTLLIIPRRDTSHMFPSSLNRLHLAEQFYPHPRRFRRRRFFVWKLLRRLQTFQELPKSFFFSIFLRDVTRLDPAVQPLKFCGPLKREKNPGESLSDLSWSGKIMDNCAESMDNPWTKVGKNMENPWTITALPSIFRTTIIKNHWDGTAFLR